MSFLFTFFKSLQPTAWNPAIALWKSAISSTKISSTEHNVPVHQEFPWGKRFGWLCPYQQWKRSVQQLLGAKYSKVGNCLDCNPGISKERGARQSRTQWAPTRANKGSQQFQGPPSQAKDGGATQHMQEYQPVQDSSECPQVYLKVDELHKRCKKKT